MANKIKMPERIAEMIIEMFAVCYDEGQGPDLTELLIWIVEHYPLLKEGKYSYLPWP